MEEIFGVPVTQILVVLVALFALVMGSILFLAWRNRLFFKLALRNVLRRRAQTTLIIVGLMLSTLIIASAFGTGDTMTNTIRANAVRDLAQVDEVVGIQEERTALDRLGPARPFPYFDQATATAFRDHFQSDPDIDGIALVIGERVPLVNSTKKQNEPRALVVAADAGFEPFSGLRSATNGRPVRLADLQPGEVYIDEKSSKDIEAAPGDRLAFFVGGRTVTLQVKDLVQGSFTTNKATLYVPLEHAQQLFQQPGQVNTIFISNRGSTVDGAPLSDGIKTRVEDYLGKDATLQVRLAKQDALDRANEIGNLFTTIFVTFGMFSIIAGLALIALIFSMLASERKPEMGMARAVGTKRWHIILSFLFEGAVYDLAASIIGVVLGIGVGFLLVGVMANAFSSAIDLELERSVQVRSLVIAFVVGMLMTFITIAIASWRVSRLNIVEAIRDVPAPVLSRPSRRTMALASTGLILGLLMFVNGIRSKTGVPLNLGMSIMILSGAVLLTRTGLPGRVAYTVAGLLLVAWWNLPFDWYQRYLHLPQTRNDISIFIIAGVFSVLGAVLVVMNNPEVLIWGATRLLTRFKRLLPAVRTALAYSMSNKFRTGVTVCIISLVSFTVLFMSILTHITSSALQNVDILSGGYTLQAQDSYNNPVPDIKAALATSSDPPAAAFDQVVRNTLVTMQATQGDIADKDGLKRLLWRGLDDTFIDAKPFRLQVYAKQFSSPNEVWQALKDHPTYALISADFVRARNNFNFQPDLELFRLQGVFLEDKTMVPVTVKLKEPLTGAITEVQVIGVVSQDAFGSLGFGLWTSQRLQQEALPLLTPRANAYLFKVARSHDPTATAHALEAKFQSNGLDVSVIKQNIDAQVRLQFTFNALIQGFMSLGLVIGIAALGVISTRAVVERRQQIGMLRAIGFRRSMVQWSFLLESAFVAGVSILVGFALALVMTYNVTGFVRGFAPTIKYSVPWVAVLSIMAIAFVASLITTVLPARQASRIYPAEALRYE